MAKENIVVFHPREWSYADYAKDARFKYHHISIGGKIPRKVFGTPTYDGYAEVVTKEGIAEFKEAVIRLRPRVVLFWMHASLPVDVLFWAKEQVKGLKIIQWYSNHRFQMQKGVLRTKRAIDALLMNSAEPQQFNMYKLAKIKHVYTFYDGFEMDTPLLDVPQDHDCFFGGYSYVKKGVKDSAFRFPYGTLRHDFIYAVAKKFKLALYSGAKNWPGLKVTPPVFHPEYTTAMRRSKVNLNINHFGFYKAYTRRTIRSIFSGRAHVTFYIPGMEDDFVNGKHLMWFHKIEEGLEQIDWLLKHDKEREEMAKNCRNLALSKFTFKHRLLQFEDILEDLGV